MEISINYHVVRKVLLCQEWRRRKNCLKVCIITLLLFIFIYIHVFIYMKHHNNNPYMKSDVNLILSQSLVPICTAVSKTEVFPWINISSNIKDVISKGIATVHGITVANSIPAFVPEKGCNNNKRWSVVIREVQSSYLYQSGNNPLSSRDDEVKSDSDGDRRF